MRDCEESWRSKKSDRGWISGKALQIESKDLSKISDIEGNGSSGGGGQKTLLEDLENARIRRVFPSFLRRSMLSPDNSIVLVKSTCKLGETMRSFLHLRNHLVWLRERREWLSRVHDHDLIDSIRDEFRTDLLEKG